jgi:PTS system mannose-specific IIA component
MRLWHDGAARPLAGYAAGARACFSSPRDIPRAICLFSDVFWLELRLLLSKMISTNYSRCEAIGMAWWKIAPPHAAGGKMIGLVLVTHGKLAEEFRHALEHVVGPQTALETVCIGPEDDMDQRRLDIVGAVSRVESGNGVIILTDMFGGTPSNLSISVMDSGRIEVIAGVNLPMLIKLAGHSRRQ